MVVHGHRAVASSSRNGTAKERRCARIHCGSRWSKNVGASVVLWLKNIGFSIHDPWWTSFVGVTNIAWSVCWEDALRVTRLNGSNFEAPSAGVWPLELQVTKEQKFGQRRWPPWHVTTSDTGCRGVCNALIPIWRRSALTLYDWASPWPYDFASCCTAGVRLDKFPCDTLRWYLCREACWTLLGSIHGPVAALLMFSIWVLLWRPPHNMPQFVGLLSYH